MVAAAWVALTGCASSPPTVAPSSSSPLSGEHRDPRLVGTWKLADAQDGSEAIQPDADTFEYLAVTSGGAFFKFEGDSAEKLRWSAADGRLMLKSADGESSTLTAVGSEAAVRIAMALSKLETSLRIHYEVSAAKLTLSGTSRLKQGSLLDPTAMPSTASPASKSVRFTYVRVRGLPHRPAEPSAQRSSPSS
jgi:hypothetical protein